MAETELYSLNCPNCSAPVPGPGKCASCGSFLVTEEEKLVVKAEEPDASSDVETESKADFSMEDHAKFVSDKAKKWGKILNNSGITLFLGSFLLHGYNMVTFFSSVHSPFAGLQFIAPFGVSAVGMGLSVAGRIISGDARKTTSKEEQDTSGNSFFSRRRTRMRQRRFRD